MGRSHFITVLFLFSIVVDCSSAYSVWNLRRLISETPKENSTGISNSPVPSPVPAEANSTVKSGGESEKEKPTGAKPLNDSDKGKPIGGNDKINATKEVKDDAKIQDQGKEQKEGKANSGSSHNGSCEGSVKKCIVPGKMIACIQDSENAAGLITCFFELGSQGNELNTMLISKLGRLYLLSHVTLRNKSFYLMELKHPIPNYRKEGDGKISTSFSLNKTMYGTEVLGLLVINVGEKPLEVKVTVPESWKDGFNAHGIPKNQSEKINVPLSVGQSTKIVLKAGDDECVINMSSNPSLKDFMQGIPSYYKQVTPIYAAYFAFLITLVVGGIWTLCFVLKKRRQDGGGVAYQELEMGVPESASGGVNGGGGDDDVANGWDEGWDDDWDEDKAVVKASGNNNISGNGLTARSSSNREGWENDWDD